MRAKNKIFHLDCFRCSACEKQLVPGDEYSLRHEELYCKDDSVDGKGSNVAAMVATGGGTVGGGGPKEIENNNNNIMHHNTSNSSEDNSEGKI